MYHVFVTEGRGRNKSNGFLKLPLVVFMFFSAFPKEKARLHIFYRVFFLFFLQATKGKKLIEMLADWKECTSQ